MGGKGEAGKGEGKANPWNMVCIYLVLIRKSGHQVRWVRGALFLRLICCLKGVRWGRGCCIVHMGGVSAFRVVRWGVLGV